MAKTRYNKMAVKVKRVVDQPLYLVPKGDKYWKISFANLERELLDDIDDKKETWRKECLKIIKKKLLQWKSKSSAGLKGISSYLLKVRFIFLYFVRSETNMTHRISMSLCNSTQIKAILILTGKAQISVI